LRIFPKQKPGLTRLGTALAVLPVRRSNNRKNSRAAGETAVSKPRLSGSNAHRRARSDVKSNVAYAYAIPPFKTPTTKVAKPPKPKGWEPGSGVGKLIKSTLGSMGLGNTVSNVLGGAGDIFSKIMGLGDYEVKSNSVVEEIKTGHQVPVMHSSNESIIVRHREYIGDVLSATNFTTTVYPVNPGLSKTFPWLSAIAQQFNAYKFKGLIFEFQSTSATSIASTNPAMGTIMLASTYNVYSPIFANKQQLDNNMWTTSGRPMDSFVHPIECAPIETNYNMYYTRTGKVLSQDLRLYDSCYLTVAAQGSQSVATVGELWATYEVELFRPICSSALGFGNRSAVYHAVDASTSTGLIGGTPVATLDTIGLTFAEQPGTAGTVHNQSVVMPKGTQGVYSFCYKQYGTLLATQLAANCVWAVYVNGATTPDLTLLVPAGITTSFQSAGAATAIQCAFAYFYFPDPNSSYIIACVNIDGTKSFLTGIFTIDLFIDQVNPTLYSGVTTTPLLMPAPVKQPPVDEIKETEEAESPIHVTYDEPNRVCIARVDPIDPKVGLARSVSAIRWT
jgi:hypothetical protein